MICLNIMTEVSKSIQLLLGMILVPHGKSLLRQKGEELRCCIILIIIYMLWYQNAVYYILGVPSSMCGHLSSKHTNYTIDSPLDHLV